MTPPNDSTDSSGSRDAEPRDPETPEDSGDARGPGRLRTWVLRPVVWLLVLLVALGAVAYLALQTEPVRERIRQLAVDRVSEALGRSVTIDELDVQPFSMTVRASGVSVPSDDPDEPPLAVAEWVEVEVDLTDLWRGSIIRLDRIEVQRPRVFLELYEDGGTNLPELPESRGGGRFEVVLDHLLVHDGVVQVEERRLPLSVDARRVRARMVGGGVLEPENTFEIESTAQRVEIVLPNAEPLTVRLDVEAVYQPGRLELTEVRAVRDLALDTTVRGSITWGEEQSAAELAVQARADAALVRELGWMDDPISGPVAFDGSVSWTPDAWSWRGTLESESLETFGRRFEDVLARVRGDAENVTVEIDEAEHAGGSLTATVEVGMEALPSGARPVDLDAAGRGMLLRRLLDDLDLPLEGLAGRVDADFAYRFDTDGVLDGDGTGEIRVAELRRPTDRLVVTGRSDLALSGGVLRLENAVLDARGQHVEADFSYDPSAGTSRASYRVESQDLERLALLVPGAEDGGEGGQPAAWVPRRGRGTFEGTLRTDPRGVSTDVRFDLVDVVIPNVEVDSLEGSLRYGGDAIQELDAVAVVGDGRVELTGSATTAGEMDLTARIDALPARAVEPFLPEGLGAEGDVSGRVRITGTFEDPGVQGDLQAEPLAVAGFAFDRARTDFRYEDGVLTVEPLEASVPAGGLVAEGSLDLTNRTMDLTARTEGLALDRPPLAGRVAGDLNGTVDLDVELTGSFEDPEGRIRLSGRDLTLAGRPLGDGLAQLDVSLQGRRLEAEGSLLELVDFSGGGRYDGETVDLTFDVSSSRVRRLLELALESPPPVDGRFEGTLGVTADAARLTETLNARLELSSFALAYEDRRIENIDPVVVELTPEALFLRSVFLGEPEGDSEMFVGGRIDLTEDEFPLDLQLQASLGADWAQLALPDLDADLEGRFDLLATIRGTVSDPRLNGQGEVREGQVILPGFPHALEQVAAVILLYPDQIILDSLRGQIAGGRVRAAGRMDMPEPDEELRYRLQAQAENLSVRWPEGWLVRGGAEMTLEAPVGDGRELRGVVNLDRAFYLRDVEVGLLSIAQGFLQRQRLDVREVDPELASTQLSLAVQGPGALRVRNNVADLTGDIDLTVRGNLARPVVFGQVELDPEGELVLRDAEYEVERGLLTFSNPYRLDPVIDLVASTEVSDYDIRLTLNGTMDNLRTSFQSDPPLADLEVLQLLATGSVGNPVGGGEGDFAENFLFGQASSALSKRVTTLFGFDKFRISPGGGDGGGFDNVGVAVEKRLGDDFYVAYTRNGTDSEETFRIGWEVTDRLTLVFSQEEDDLALDVLWEKVF